MANHFFLFLLLIFGLSVLCHKHTKGSGSSGAGVAPQTCGIASINFYCPVDHLCKPRGERCTGTDVCIDPETNREEMCFESSISGKYDVFLGHVKLGMFGSKRDLQLKREHQFITFRGFT